MSQIEQLKLQLHSLADQSRSGVASLAGFRQRFEQAGQHVQALIAGSATGADRDITTVLEAAAKSVDQAMQALQIAETGCRSYANQI